MNNDMLTELLRLTDRSGPLPRDLEETLLAELHNSLAQGPLARGDTDSGGIESVSNEDTARDGIDSDVVVALDLRTVPSDDRRNPRRRQLWWATAAAAAALVVGLVVGMRPSPQSTDVADQPVTTSTATPATPAPVLADLAAACARFSESTPSRQDVTNAVENADATAITSLDEVVAAMDVLLIDAAASGQLTDNRITSLEVARGLFRQASIELNAGIDAAQSLANAHEGLAGAFAGTADFTDCRSY